MKHQRSKLITSNLHAGRMIIFDIVQLYFSITTTVVLSTLIVPDDGKFISRLDEIRF